MDYLIVLWYNIQTAMKLGFLGLGKMGSRMVKKLLTEGHDVVAWNRSPEPIEQLKEQIASTDNLSKHFSTTSSIEEVVQQLPSPRILWVMLPAGDPTETVMQQLFTLVSPGDIVIDGGNANYKDTERRFNLCKEKDIRYLGIGVSGGVLAEQNGFPMMVGGDKSAYEEIRPILDTFAKPHGGHTYFGTGGAGHFIKMVHNGVEYGMMQAIGEGFDVVANSQYKFDLLQVAQIWQKGSIVSGFLLDRAADALTKDPTLNEFAGPVGENGEAAWTIDAAREEKIPVKVIEDSLEYRKETQKNPELGNSVTAKMVSGLRNAFGGHVVKK